MPRSSTTFAVGNPGRPVGTEVLKVKRTKSILFKLTSDPKFEQTLRAIMLNPKHKDWRFVVELAFNYTLGKPTENIHQTSDGSLPATQLQVAFVDYDQFFGAGGIEQEKVVSHDGGDSAAL